MRDGSPNVVVRLLDVGQREPVGREGRRVEPAAADEVEQRRHRAGVDQAGGDRQVADPQLSRWSVAGVAVDADVREVAARPDELGAELERLGGADGLDRDVGAEPVA